MLHLHPNMHHLNPNSLKHNEFFDATHFLIHVIIDHQNITQSPCNYFMEANQDKIVEEIGAHNFFFMLWE